MRGGSLELLGLDAAGADFNLNSAAGHALFRCDLLRCAAGARLFLGEAAALLQLLEQEIAITHFIAWHHDALEFLADQFFDVGQSALFFAADKRDGDPRLAGAAGATNTVHIVLSQEGRS